jgi:hypothetical protein
MNFNELATKEVVEQTIAALKQNGIEALVVQNGEEAKQKVLELLPKGAEVMTMTSMTLKTLGLDTEINESGNYEAVMPKLYAMDRKTHNREMQKLGAAPAWAVGSVHAVTQAGQVIVASNTGSQLPAYAYAGGNVVWVVGAQKLVENLDQGFKRIFEYVLPLENERAMKAYGKPSSVNKSLIIDKEVVPNRITMIIVKEKLGF